MRKRFFLLIIIIASTIGAARAQQPFIHLNSPRYTHNKTSYATHFIVGATCKGCRLSINGDSVKVYRTGGFAYRLDLQEGDNTFVLHSKTRTGHYYTKTIYFTYTKDAPEEADSTFTISSVKVFPEGNLLVSPGDVIKVRVKAESGWEASWLNGQQLHELPAYEAGIKGIYQGEYTVQPGDKLPHHIKVTLTNNHGKSISKSSLWTLTMMPDSGPMIGKTSGEVPYLEFGLGADRLGGAKMTYIDTAVVLKIVGKVNDQYKVQLAKNLTAYIPDDAVDIQPVGSFYPNGLSSSWRVYGDKKYDYVSIALPGKLPYQSYQKVDPNKIIVDIYGAQANTNWISQLQSAKEIKNVDYDQLQDDILRVTIELKHHQNWGYAIYYEGNHLTVRVKRQPKLLDLKHLTIAIDPGHGGSNYGALGPTGAHEKILTLQIAKRLQADLKKMGANVIMTRTKDETESMVQRILFLREADPDLLVSIHLNASGNPIDVKGTSTYYRYLGFRSLSMAIYKRMLGTGLKGFGNIGRFNFALNGPTEYPNALVETLFLSNPADEEKVLSPQFQQKMANAIMHGIQDFLQGAKVKQ